MVMRPNVRVMIFPLPIQIPLWIAVLVGFVLVTFFPGVAWQAHLGGILYGAAVGFYFAGGKSADINGRRAPQSVIDREARPIVDG